MDIAMTTTSVMPTVAALLPRTESFYELGTGIAAPLTWHGDVVRTGLPGVQVVGAASVLGRVVSDLPSTTRSRRAFADTRNTAKQPHPPRGVPR
jgi:hypothetical protein